MVPPHIMCKDHLLGEHRELHALVGIVARGTRLDGYVAKGLIDTGHITQRHDDLVKEMLSRGWNHYSPLAYESQVAVGHVDSMENINELRRRCAACKERIDGAPTADW